MSRAFLKINYTASSESKNPYGSEEELQKMREKLGTRVVQKGDKIQVLCVGKAEGNDFDAGMFDNDMTVFVAGEGKGLLMPALDGACMGLQLNETRKFDVKPGDEGHPQSERDESLVVQVPTGGAKVNTGTTVRLNHEGQLRLAMVIKVEDGNATLDMNDPLAGRVLHYEVTLKAFDAEVNRIKQLFPEPIHVPDRTFDLNELRMYNGQNNMPIYLGCNGLVYDMTAGAKFYGPGGTYGFMAGYDATVALAKFSMNPGFLNQKWILEEFEENELNTLANYCRTFEKKYPIVGKYANKK
jgi:FKBP-type peptidyl-prolyl cis-trans isomerase 2|tara:strand:+ start:215 stop:1108 length:894 start_codon:yes stop_codon:yes gene_type:complete